MTCTLHDGLRAVELDIGTKSFGHGRSPHRRPARSRAPAHPIPLELGVAVCRDIEGKCILRLLDHPIIKSVVAGCICSLFAQLRLQSLHQRNQKTSMVSLPPYRVATTLAWIDTNDGSPLPGRLVLRRALSAIRTQHGYMFRFVPKLGHRSALPTRRFCARSRPHSTTSSARTSNEAGTVSPSAFAVFMLITSSNLVGCSTGRSAGLVPLRILST